MVHGLLADGLVVIHFAFLLFVVLGGLLVIRYPRVAWLHLPAAAWGALVELMGWVCPLTPWEQALRRRAGEVGYTEGFIEHYLAPILYPTGLTRTVQVGLGVAVLVLNAAVYLRVWRRRRSGDHGSRPGP
jgi:hypothetical protein